MAQCLLSVQLSCWTHIVERGRLRTGLAYARSGATFPCFVSVRRLGADPHRTARWPEWRRWNVSPARNAVQAIKQRRLDGESDPVKLEQPVAARFAAIVACCALLLNVIVGTPLDYAHARATLTAEERVSTELFRENTPAVVYITNLAVRRDYLTPDMREVPQGAGSGFLWDDDGHVVTNFHVIKGASDVLVTFTGGDEFSGSVVGFDQDRDVAVLKVQFPENKSLPKPLRLGTSSDLLVGQRVYAIGNPFGLDHTLTTGVISGTGREINSGNTGRPIQDVIQTDAAINPGNSGGPLLDSGGYLVGINTAIYSPSGANSGVGFAIPVDGVKSSVDQIIQFGKVVRPVLGISIAPEQSIDQLGVSGILVLEARKGGPAFKAGIRSTTRDEFGRLVFGDIITSFNGKKIKNSSDLYKQLDKTEVGDVVELEVLRGNQVEHVQVTLEASQ